MRIAATLAGVLLGACSAATAAPAPTPVEAPLLISEGGVVRPIENGARLPLRNGSAAVELWPSPRSMDPDVKVTLFDATGSPVAGNVSLDYESVDMDHGVTAIDAKLRDGAYVMRCSFAMPGSWRIHIHIARGASAETLTLLVPWVGL